MLKNYFKTAIRNLYKSKGFSFINISGLAVGLACCILIFLFVREESGIDLFHQDADNIYRVTSILERDGEAWPVMLTQAPLANLLKDDFPEIIESASFNYQYSDLVQYGEKTFLEGGFALTNPGFFRIFSYPFLQGSPETALEDPGSVVISQEVAQKYFENKNPLGEILNFKELGAFKVTGVLADEQRSHLALDIILSNQIHQKMGIDISRWDNFNYSTYVLLQKGADEKLLQEKLKNHIYREEAKTQLNLQPMTDIYLHSAELDYDIHARHGSFDLLYTLSLVAVFILLLACINFTNLSTARSEKRMKEIGLRKTIGARRGQVIWQFIGESVFQALLAMLISMVLVEFSLPLFNDLLSRELAFLPFTQPEILLGLTIFAFFTGLLAGFYPALHLSSFHPVHILKGGKTGKGRNLFRKALVISQFACSIVLIIATLGVFRQLNFIQNKDLGYEKTQLMTYTLNPDIERKYDAFKTHLKKYPAILNVTASENLPTWSWPARDATDWDGKRGSAKIIMNRAVVDYDYFTTYGMEILEGRAFSKDFPSDLTDAIIVNKTAVERMEMENPIGKRVHTEEHSGVIIGVVKDFHFNNLRSRINPLIIRLSPNETRVITLRVEGGKLPETMAYLETASKMFAPDYPAEYRFLTAGLERLYRHEMTIGKAAAIFAMLAILIASLGIFGLASHAAERRTKEIGVRKVLGASVPNIIAILSGEFLRLIGIAFIIACPLAYVLLDTWLQSYAYRISIEGGIFAIAGIIAIFIAFLSVGYQSIKTAFSNPVEALRYE